MLITPVLGTWDDVEAAGVGVIKSLVIQVMSRTSAKRHWNKGLFFSFYLPMMLFFIQLLVKIRKNAVDFYY